MTRTGGELFDAELPQDETRLRELLSRLSAFGRVLVVVDQPEHDRGAADRSRAGR